MSKRKPFGVIWLFLTALASLSPLSPALVQSETFDWSTASQLGSYMGIKRAYLSVTSPRVNHINCLQIDTWTPNLRFYTTPRCSPYDENNREADKQRTRTFVTTSQSTDRKIVAAINANAFDMASDPTNLLGLVVSEGVQVSPGSGESSFLVNKRGRPSIATTTPRRLRHRQRPDRRQRLERQCGALSFGGRDLRLLRRLAQPANRDRRLPQCPLCVLSDRRRPTDHEQRGVRQRSRRLSQILRLLGRDQCGRWRIDDYGMAESQQQCD